MTEAPVRLTAALADRYRIERELGAGGMATVYLAHDLKHDRRVAIKVLRPELAAVIGAERFLREIRTIANLQHPHILGLIDSGELHGTAYYVMPFVDGESLRDRLSREKQLPIADAVRLATEVAGALDYAHRQGVIHRDIKPENIMLHDGRALVADFGIALAVSSAGGSRMTETGMSLGTPHYMSPEQAMGEREITARSDVYALGAMTYEMLIGDPPFTGSTAQAIVAKVMTEKPVSLQRQRERVPDTVEDAVLTALEKLPADRFGTAAEFAGALNGEAGAGRPPRTGSPSRAGKGSRFRDPVVVTLAVLAVAAAALAWAGRGSTPADAPVVSFSLQVPRTGSTVLGFSSVAISPDGQTLVYVGAGDGFRQQLVARRIDEVTEHPLPGTGEGAHPVFSPDGRWVAFIRGNQLFRVAIEGGQPQFLGNAQGTFNGMSWSSSGDIVLSGNTTLYLLPQAGGSPKEFARRDPPEGELYLDTPMVVDEADVILYSSWEGTGPGSARIAIASRSDGTITVLDVPGVHPVGVFDGILLYATPSGTLMGVPIDLPGRRVTGTPVQLLTDIAVNNSTGIARIGVSRSGTLIYEQGTAVSRVVLVTPEGAIRSLVEEPREYAFPRLSPDGRSLAITIGQGGRRDIWLFDRRLGTSTRLTTEGLTNERPEWTPDGRRVLYRTDRSARASIWWQPVDRSAEATPLLQGGRMDLFEAVVSPDGNMVAYQLDTLGADLYARRLSGDTTPIPIATSARGIETMPRISPDGRWIAFTTDESGVDEVVVQPFPGPGGRVQVSSGGGSQPVWSRDGRQLFYRGGGSLMAARLEPGPAFRVASRTALFPDSYSYATNPHANFDVTPEGDFVLLEPVGESKMIVITNWVSRMRARMAEGR